MMKGNCTRTLTELILITVFFPAVCLQRQSYLSTSKGNHPLNTIKTTHGPNVTSGLGKKSFLLSMSSPSSAETLQVRRKESFKMSGKFKLMVSLTLWYFISAVYNIYNKRALNLLGTPWFVATIQMGMGIFLFIPLWLMKLRQCPFNSISELLELIGNMREVAIYQTLTHAAGVIALGSGAVSFTQVVKASEPLFTASISAIFFRKVLSWQSYASLIVVVLGVGIASVNELTFSWYCLFFGITANIFSAARGVFAKTQMCGDVRCVEELSAENYYAIITLMSFLLLIPMTVAAEGSQILAIVSQMLHANAFTTSAGVTSGPALRDGLLSTLISGILFYAYNELSFTVLDNVHPVTHALANTVKRVVIILSSVIMFQNQMTPLGIVGASVATLGVGIYSLCQHYFQTDTEKNK